MIEGHPQQPEYIERKNLEIDNENLDGQLEKASEVLLEISKNNNFSTFSHFEKLRELVEASGGNPSDAIELLKKWEYSSLDFIQTEKCGNCVDFAILGQKMLLDAGLPTTIIGKQPDPKEFSQVQIDFMGYRHTSLLYANESNGLQLFMFEPGWKFPQPISVTPGTVSGNQDWQFETIKMDKEELIQRTFNVAKKKTNERTFDTRALDTEYCQQLTKHLIRIPRKLEMVNKLEDGVSTCYIRFDPNKQTLVTNIREIDAEFLPDNLSAEQIDVLEKSFKQSGLVQYLSNILKFYKSLPADFWIK